MPKRRRPSMTQRGGLNSRQKESRSRGLNSKPDSALGSAINSPIKTEPHGIGKELPVRGEKKSGPIMSILFCWANLTFLYENIFITFFFLIFLLKKIKRKRGGPHNLG
uniref:Uncharacterized protein n=1 Tax=Morchella importuna TaxID=1174673 RepID=A0A650AGA2_9PEZI|nr:hypothetical protein [Morchella importuna]QGN66729.1 hypothetical protein [Morchella importuna]